MHIVVIAQSGPLADAFLGLFDADGDVAGRHLTPGDIEDGTLATLPHTDIVLVADQPAAMPRALRAAGYDGPLMVLGADDGALQGSADTMPTPVRYHTLLHRMRSCVRSHQQSDEAERSVGPYRFRPAERRLLRADGSEIALTDKEAAMVRYLSRAAAPVSREQLLEAVWGYSDGVTTHTVETHIYRLRQKIEPEPANATILVTEDDGYVLRGSAASGQSEN